MRLAAFALAASALALSFTALAEAPKAHTPALATAAEAQADPANWRAVDPQNLFIFNTTKGRILIEAIPEIAPKHYKQFAAIVRSGDLDGTDFHRVLDGFMAQGGDIFALKGRESGLPDVEAEFTFKRDPAEMPLDATVGPEDTARWGYYKGFPIGTQPSFFADMSADGMVESYIPHCIGIVSTARLPDNPDSANSQFFLMRGRAKHLDREYSVWGRVVEGEDVVQALKHRPDNRDAAVPDPDILKSAKIAADLPEAERPKVWVMRTDGPRFQDSLAEQGEVPDVCDLTSVVTAVEN